VKVVTASRSPCVLMSVRRCPFVSVSVFEERGRVAIPLSPCTESPCVRRVSAQKQVRGTDAERNGRSCCDGTVAAEINVTSFDAIALSRLRVLRE
jgi:hypothetical protein